MPFSVCPECDQDVRITGRPRIALRVVCQHCGAQLEVVETDPLELDWVYDGGDDDEDDELLDEDEDDELDDTLDDEEESLDDLDLDRLADEARSQLAAAFDEEDEDGGS